jgi:hypothetical protein
MEINTGANSTYKKLAVLCFADIPQYCAMVIHPYSYWKPNPAGCGTVSGHSKATVNKE